MASTMVTVVLLVPVVVPALAAGLAAVLGWRGWVAWCAVAASAAVLAAGVVAAVATVDGSVLTLGGLLRVDALTAVMLLVIGGVSVIATWASVGYIDGELKAHATTARGARRYAILVPLFIGTMAGTVLAANLGVMWAGIEATTIVILLGMISRITRTSSPSRARYSRTRRTIREGAANTAAARRRPR